MKNFLEKIIKKKEIIKVYFRIWIGFLFTIVLVWCQFFNILDLWIEKDLNIVELINITMHMTIGIAAIIYYSKWLKPIFFFLKRRRRLPYNKNDGGRSNYFNGKANDCVVRGIAIATGKDYMDTYNELLNAIKDGVNIDIDGVKPRIVKKYLESLGWKYNDFHGKGGKITKNNPNIPKKGIIICNTPGHITTIVDGIIQDNFNSSEMELEGYFYKEEEA